MRSGGRCGLRWNGHGLRWNGKEGAAARLVGAALILGLSLAGAGVAWPEEPDDSVALERLLAHRALRGAKVGVSVLDLDTGEVLLEHAAEQALVPASNQKLLVSAATLSVWGPAHRFETVLYAEQAPDDEGVVDGPLWVVGGGDPSLVSESLWRLAEELRLRGVQTVRGGIIVDASWFDGRRTHPDWEPLSRRAYHSPVGAFAANYSSFRVEVRAAAAADRAAHVAVVPTIPYFRVRADAQTIPGRGTLKLDLTELPDGSGERVRVRGAMRVGQLQRTYWRSVTLPERYAAELLRSQLRIHGIRVDGPTRMGAVPRDAIELLRFRGEPLAQIVRDMNKYSNNFIAEQLTKGLGAERDGAPGTWASGVSVIREVLGAQGVLGPGTVLADGSGLSPRNRVSGATLARLVRYAARRPGWGPEFLASLPIGGRDGTLEERALDPAVSIRGKTGHLRRVASLSGVLSGRDGRRVFAVLVNGARGGRLDVDLAIDEFVTRLGASGDGPAVVGSEQGSGSEPGNAELLHDRQVVDGGARR